MEACIRLFFRALCLSLLLVGCAKSAGDDALQEPEFTAAVEMLNQKRFEEATVAFERLAARYPKSTDVKRKLMHALAGAAGFDAIAFKVRVEGIAKKLEEGSYDPKRSLADEWAEYLGGRPAADPVNYEELRARQMVGTLERISRDLPGLDDLSHERLVRALDLYGQLGFRFETATEEDNFQWGIITIYRAMADTRGMAASLAAAARSEDALESSDLDSRLLKAISRSLRDVYRTYKLFSYSYSKLRGVAERMDTFVTKLVGGEGVTILRQSNSADDFVRQLVRYNLEPVADAAAAMSTVPDGSLTRGLRQVFFGNRKASAPERYRYDRTRAFNRVLLREWSLADEMELRAPGALLSRELVDEVEGALARAGDVGSLLPLYDLQREQGSAFHRLAQVGSLLVNEAPAREIAPDYRKDVVALRDRVDEEQLRLVRGEADRLRSEFGRTPREGRPRFVDMEKYTLGRFRTRSRAEP